VPDDKEKIILKKAWKEAAQKLRKIEIETPLLDARLLLQHVLNIKYEQLITSGNRELTEQEIESFNKLVARRLLREPIAKILEKKEFWGLGFKTTKDTLDPRPDSETLIECVIQTFKDSNRDLNILDLGTGSGCLLITLLFLYNNSKGLGVDKSIEALKIAGENAESNNVSERANFIVSNWLDNVEGTFDVIICNPPYIKREATNYLSPEVRLYDPIPALDGGADGLDCYREIISQLGKFLAIHGRCFFEIGKWQEHEVSDLISENGFEIIEVRNDLAGIPRVIVFTKPYLKVVK